MNPECRLYIRRGEVASASELSAQVSDIEEIDRQRRKQQREERKITAGPTVAAAVYNRDECCWRCKQSGRTWQDCRWSRTAVLPAPRAKKFCSRCGKNGVLTHDCHLHAGNGARAGQTAAITQIRVKFTSRPYISICLARQTVWALLDSSSQVSFLSVETARRLGLLHRLLLRIPHFSSFIVSTDRFL